MPDIRGPVTELCWEQAPGLERCDRRLRHGGRHSWEAPAVRQPTGITTTVLDADAETKLPLMIYQLKNPEPDAPPVQILGVLRYEGPTGHLGYVVVTFDPAAHSQDTP